MKPLAVFFILAQPALSGGIYTIGNSLTWDAVPTQISGIDSWHVDCSKSLPFIYVNPSDPCEPASTIWPIALADRIFDIVTVQPHGDTIAANVSVISKWMGMQPSAAFVVHTGWPAHSAFDSQSQQYTEHAQAITDTLREAFPSRSISRDYSIEALQRVKKDIEAGVAPFESLADLYRDDVHLTRGFNEKPSDHGEGRYLIHNVLRAAIGQPINSTMFPQMPLATREYLHSVVAQVTGDFTGDGVVDAADYVMWRKWHGSGEGFAAWRANFRHESARALASYAIPEPSLAVFLIHLAWLSVYRCPKAIRAR